MDDANQADDQVIYQSGPLGLTLIRIYASGRVDRHPFTTLRSPPGLDPTTGVTSKDVLISPTTPLSARLYLPPNPNPNPNPKSPILLYFHGGGFCIGSAFNPVFHSFLNSLVARSNALALSLDYRLAPEHPIPAAYDDAWAAIRWLFGRADDWVAERGDLGRVFVAGDSAGGNIAHQTAVRAGRDGEGEGIRVLGMVLVHPYFLGSGRVGSEALDPAKAVSMVETWRVACPSSSGTDGLDDPRIDPTVGDLKGIGCERALVCVAEKDVLRDRGKAYCEAVRGSGWGGELVEYEAVGLGHCGHLFEPESEVALDQTRVIVEFITRL